MSVIVCNLERDKERALVGSGKILDKNRGKTIIKAQAVSLNVSLAKYRGVTMGLKDLLFLFLFATPNTKLYYIKKGIGHDL